MTAALQATLLALACCGVSAFRDDPGRRLVRVNASLPQLRVVRSLGRDDLESVRDDEGFVLIWADREHMKSLDAANLGYAPAVDISALSFAQERLSNYSDTPNEEPEWTEYCGYDCMVERLAEMASENGCRFPFELVKFGESVNGRDLWAAHIGTSGPEVLLGGNIHGDEPVGNQLMQRWMWETCNAPTHEQEQVADAVNAWYIPNLNPDGYELNRRNNGNNFDLNRNFPLVTGGGATVQPETQAYMAFIASRAFTISTHFHGGAVVCNTAYDSCYTSDIVRRPCPPALPVSHPREEWIDPSSRAYCDAMMAAGVVCNVGTECQTNGASWYQITGSEQDWVFHFENVVAMTMEMTRVKRPAGSTLPATYQENYMAFHDFMLWPTTQAGKQLRHKQMARQGRTSPADLWSSHA